MRADEPDNLFGRERYLSLVLLLVLLVVFVGLVTTFYVTHFTAYVDGDSMLPTLTHGELVLVTRGYDDPRRGDVVVIVNDTGGKNLVKRVVAVAGDEIVVEEGRAFINGGAERGSHTVLVADADLSVPRQVVPEGTVFLLGDNRPISEDSRIFGMVPVDSIRGEVIAVLLPFPEAGLVD